MKAFVYLKSKLSQPKSIRNIPIVIMRNCETWRRNKKGVWENEDKKSKRQTIGKANMTKVFCLQNLREKALKG